MLFQRGGTAFGKASRDAKKIWSEDAMNAPFSVIASEAKQSFKEIATSPMAPRKDTFLSTISFLFLFFGVCHADAVAPQVCHLDNCVTVEVVSKQDNMQRGLMNRTSLGQNKGMLFVFTHDDKYSFWMKNMKFNLDILWINLEGRIVYIGQNIPACTSGPCLVYTPVQKARFVLELNSGYTTSHRWKAGDNLDLKGIS
jgi:uncharacterized membrane protein (UPF0127 family)